MPHRLPIVAAAAIGLLFSASVRTAILATVVAGILKLKRRPSPALRQSLWLTVLSAMLVLPALNVMVGWPTITIPGTYIASLKSLLSASQRLIDAKSLSTNSGLQTKNTDADRSRPRQRGPFPIQTSSSSLLSLLFMIYAMGVILFMLRVLLSVILTRNFVRKCASIDLNVMVPRCSHFLQNRLSGGHVAFVSDPKVVVPITVGWRRPTILLPSAWPEWSPAKLDAVLAHELTHIRRNDYALNLLAAINRGLYWFHPVAWIIPGQISRAAEEAGDAEAVAIVSSRKQYALYLLEIGAAMEGRSHRILTHGAAIAGPDQLALRIDTILDPNIFSYCTWTGKRVKAATLLGIVTILLLAVPHLTAGPPSMPPQTVHITPQTSVSQDETLLADESFADSTRTVDYPFVLTEFTMPHLLTVSAYVRSGTVRWEVIDPSGTVQSRIRTTLRAEAEMEDFKQLKGTWLIRVTINHASGKYQVRTRGIPR
jgi:beta-lactamase regulating signal transducer with metallopeptidase domain